MPTPPSAGSVAVAALVAAVVLAVAATLLPVVRLPLILAAVLIAVPASVVALRRARAMPGGDRDLIATQLDGSLTDPITGAGNAEALEQALDAAVLDPSAAPLALVRIALTSPDPCPSAAIDDVDLDDDDVAADRRALVLAAIRFQEILRPGDLLARIEGRELAVLLPRCDARAVKAVVGRLRAAVPDRCLLHGVATWDGAESASGLRARADHALDRDRLAAAADPLLDPDRLAAVAATGLAVRRPVDEFNEIATGIAALLRTPIVAISLFDESWQHYIGEHGIGSHGGATEGTATSDAICRTTVSSGRPLVVSDTRRHPVLQHVPAARDHGVLACASVPITSAEGHVLGSVCAMVLERHTWSAEDVTLLKLTASRIAERLAELPTAALTAA